MYKRQAPPPAAEPPAGGAAPMLRSDAHAWWRDADIVFVASLLFPDETMRALAARLALLRPGARVLSLRRLPEGTPFRPAAFKS